MPIERKAGPIIDPISGTVIGWYEQRGDKLIEILTEDNGSPEKLGREERLIVEGARRELQTASYPTDVEIVEAAQRAGDDIETALMAATDTVAKAEGHTSRLWLAMRYLVQRCLLQLRVVSARDKGNEAMAAAALGGGVVFGFALLDWHQAFHGTDDAAFHGRRQSERLAKGSIKNRARRLKQWDIIARAVGDDIDNSNVRCKTFIDKLPEINAALEREGEPKLIDKSEPALTKNFQRIRDWRRKGSPTGGA
jgi:hypothetical protein